MSCGEGVNGFPCCEVSGVGHCGAASVAAVVQDTSRTIHFFRWGSIAKPVIRAVLVLTVHLSFFWAAIAQKVDLVNACQLLVIAR